MQTQIQLKAEQTIYQASETHQIFVSALHEASEIELDLSQIQEADSSCVQILLWLQRESSRLSKPVHFLKPSPTLCNVVQALGLHDVLPSDFGATS